MADRPWIPQPSFRSRFAESAQARAEREAREAAQRETAERARQYAELVNPPPDETAAFVLRCAAIARGEVAADFKPPQQPEKRVLTDSERADVVALVQRADRKRRGESV